MASRREVLEEKFSNFRSYLRANCPPENLKQLEGEVLQKDTEDIVLYIQSQSSLNVEEGAARFIDRYGIPRFMQTTVHRYFTCFDYLIMDESIDWMKKAGFFFPLCL